MENARQIKPDSPPPNIEVETQIGQNDVDPQNWRVEINIQSGQKTRSFPYSIDLGITGYFRVVDEYPSEKAPLLVEVNGPSILYAAAREFVSILTSRGPYPPMLLPSLSFIPEPEEKDPPGTVPKKLASPSKKKAKTKQK